jgi:hypothetical protein
MLCPNLSQLAALPSEGIRARLYKEDRIYQAAVAMLTDGNIESWTVFTAQILWDIQDELAEEIVRGPAILREVGQQITAKYHRYLTSDCTDKNNKKHKAFTKEMKKLTDAVDAVTQEDSFQSRIDANMTTHKLPNKPAFSLLDCHPSLCDLATTHILDSYQKLTFDFVSDTGHILAIAHLYNAAKHSKATPKDFE